LLLETSYGETSKSSALVDKMCSARVTANLLCSSGPGSGALLSRPMTSAVTTSNVPEAVGALVGMATPDIVVQSTHLPVAEGFASVVAGE
jgi:hypothetical protein